MKEEIDALDAAVFSGCSLFDCNERENLRQYLERWERAIKEYEEMDDD